MTPAPSPPTARAIAHDVLSGALSAEDAARDAFARGDAAQVGPDGLNALLWTDRKRVLEEARELKVEDEKGGDPGLLSGVPIAVKDNIATLSLPTSCGSRILEGYVSPFEATAITRLRNAGAVVIGKTTMD